MMCGPMWRVPPMTARCMGSLRCSVFSVRQGSNAAVKVTSDRHEHNHGDRAIRQRGNSQSQLRAANGIGEFGQACQE